MEVTHGQWLYRNLYVHNSISGTTATFVIKTDSHFKTLHQSKCFGDLIDNRSNAPIYVVEDKEREKHLNLRYELRDVFGGKCTV